MCEFKTLRVSFQNVPCVNSARSDPQTPTPIPAPTSYFSFPINVFLFILYFSVFFLIFHGLEDQGTTDPKDQRTRGTQKIQRIYSSHMDPKDRGLHGHTRPRKRRSKGSTGPNPKDQEFKRPRTHRTAGPQGPTGFKGPKGHLQNPRNQMTQRTPTDQGSKGPKNPNDPKDPFSLSGCGNLFCFFSPSIKHLFYCKWLCSLFLLFFQTYMSLFFNTHRFFLCMWLVTLCFCHLSRRTHIEKCQASHLFLGRYLPSSFFEPKKANQDYIHFKTDKYFYYCQLSLIVFLWFLVFDP